MMEKFIINTIMEMKFKQIRFIVFLFIIFSCWQQCLGLTNHNFTKHYTITVGRSLTLNYLNIWRAKSFGALPWGEDAGCLSVTTGFNGQNGWCTIYAANKTSKVPTVTVSYHYQDAGGLMTDSYNYYNNITIVELEAVKIPNTLTLDMGQNYTFSPVLTPSSASTAYDWFSSNESIVRVVDGTITAIKEGDAVITCITHNGKTSECRVTIKPLLVENLTIQPEELKIKCGQRYQLNAIISPENASVKKIKWESSNQEVALVTNEGRVIALSPGWSIITANTTDASDISSSCILEVEAIKAESISLSQDTIRDYIGSSTQLVASILPEETANKSVNWSSNAPTIVSVDKNGVVKLLEEGVATITATTTDGTNLSASCIVDVSGASNLNNFENEGVRVYAKENEIYVSNVDEDEEIRIYNSLGQIIYIGPSKSIQVRDRGLYIVIVAGLTVKVLL